MVSESNVDLLLSHPWLIEKINLALRISQCKQLDHAAFPMEEKKSPIANNLLPQIPSVINLARQAAFVVQEKKSANNLHT